MTSLRNVRTFGPLFARDSMLKPGTTLHAEPVPKVLARGKAWEGDLTPEEDLKVAEVLISAHLRELSPDQRKEFFAKLEKYSVGTSFEVSRNGIATVAPKGAAAPTAAPAPTPAAPPEPEPALTTAREVNRRQGSLDQRHVVTSPSAINSANRIAAEAQRVRSERDTQPRRRI